MPNYISQTSNSAPDDELDPPMPASAQDDLNNKYIRAALDLVEDNRIVKRERDGYNDLIIKLFEQGFIVSDPAGARKIGSQVLQQAFWRTMNRMKPLDFEINGTARPEEVEALVTSGVSTIMERGGYTQTMVGKQGVFTNMLLFGDAFFTILPNPNPDEANEVPFIFNPIPNSNVYVDTFATDVRAGGIGRAASQMLVVQSVSWAEACQLFPKMKKIGGMGRIPRDLNYLKESGRSNQQTIQMEDEEKVEIGYFFDIRNSCYVVFAGAKCTILEEHHGKDFPFMMKSKPYLPVIHYYCTPSAEGFYNHGLGDMLYRLAVVSRQLLNMAIGHAEDSVYPITLVNVPQGETAKFFQKIQSANELRSTGKKALVAMEYDPANPSSGRVQSQTLIGQSLLQEWQILYEQMSKEIARLGINLDDLGRDPATSATQIIAEEENSNAFVKQMMEYNSQETKFTVEVVLELVKDFIDKRNKLPLNLMTQPFSQGKPVPEIGLTMGNVAEELQKHNWYVSVNSRSGAIPSNSMKQAQMSRILAMLQPGSPAYYSTLSQFSRLNGIDMDASQFQPPAPPPGAGGDQGGGSGAPIAPGGLPMNETDRMVISPRATKNPVAAL